MGGGVMLDAGTHAISACRYFMGEVSEVAAITESVAFKQIAPLEDTAMLLLRFASGALGTVSVTGVAQRERPRTEFVVLGSKGTIELDTHDRKLITTSDGQRGERVFMAASRGFVEQIAHFMDCLRDGRTPLTTPAEQVGSLKTVLAAYRSAKERRFVKLSEL
jgi:predicted dehydrogenase